MNYEPPMDFASWPPQDKANWLALVERKRCEATSGNSPKGLEPTLAPSTISQATREYHAERDLREPLRNRHDEQLRVAAPAQSGRPATCVDLICASSLNPEPVSWLWQWWLARGKMHIVGGQPGAGKTTLAMLMTSIVTRGGRWPDGSLSPSGTVVIWSGEDDPADTLVPRLIAMRADMEKVHFVGGVMEGGERRPFDPAKDIPALAQAIGNLGNVALIIVDPVVSAVAGDSHKNTETRRSLQPLVDLAASVGSALLGITHFTKGTAGREPVERITGSLAFAALARIVMIAAKEAEGEGDAPPRRFLARAKSNIGPDDGGFAYDLQQVPMPGDDSIVASIATFGEAIEGTARAMLAVAESEPCEDRDALSEAESFLQEQLTGGPVPTNTLKAAAGAHAISWRTIERAKKSLGVEASQKERKWFWKLTPPATPTPNSWRSGGLNLEEGDEI
jgi:putative DNA primase/helicase